MLRISTVDQGDKVTIKLEGKISGPWVEELSNYWQRSKSSYGGKKVTADLSSVTFVDLAGKKLLCSISREGVQLAGSGLVPKH